MVEVHINSSEGVLGEPEGVSCRSNEGPNCATENPQARFPIPVTILGSNRQAPTHA